MLFTDGIFYSADDLLKIDSEIQDIASTASPTIDLNAVLADAQMEVGDYLLSLNIRYTSGWGYSYSGSAYGPLIGLFSNATNTPQLSLSQVVVTNAEYPTMPTALKRYTMYVALANFYRDASRRKKADDRLAEKRDEYQLELKNKYEPRMRKAGIPVVQVPMPRPGALFLPAAGLWNEDNVTAVDGGSSSVDASYDVAITWVNPTVGSNNESAPTDRIEFDVPSGSMIRLDITRLRPPDGTYPAASLATYPVTPMVATAWNVYIGPRGGMLTRQNTDPIALSIKQYTVDIPTTTGPAVGIGQFAETSLFLQGNVLQRA